MKDIKYITIHGPATCYKAIIFRLGDHPLEQKAGYGSPRYIGMIILDPDYRKVLIDDKGGYPPWALQIVNLDPNNWVLSLGWETVLKKFDEIPDGGNIEVTPESVKITDKWHF